MEKYLFIVILYLVGYPTIRNKNFNNIFLIQK